MPDQKPEIPLHGSARVISRDELRESYFRLLCRSYSRAKASGEELVVYRSAADMAYRLCGQGWAQRTIFSLETALVRRFISETSLDGTSLQAAVQLSLMSNPWNTWWSPALHAMHREQFLSLCHVRGIEHLQAAQSSGRGVVIAHAHTLFAQLFWTWMKHVGIVPGVTIWQWAWGRPLSEIGDPRIRAVESARELHGAMQTLKSGGLCHIMADGDKGSLHVPIPFCGRQRLFQTTFAELALATRAVIITVFVTFAADGSISIRFGSPLDDTATDGNRAERLVRLYAKQLSAMWQEHPADIPWFQMKRHLDLPRPGENR